MSALEHIFQINLECSDADCEEKQYLGRTISEILNEIYSSGWPICPECGDDMDFSIEY